MSSTKKESREEANEDSEEQDVTEAGREFQSIEQEALGRKEDRWAEVEHKGTSIDFGYHAYIHHFISSYAVLLSFFPLLLKDSPAGKFIPDRGDLLLRQRRHVLLRKLA